MNLPQVVDVAIGLFFVYLLYSLLVSVIQELIATYFGFRSKILEQGIARMLQDDDKYPCRSKRVVKLFVKSPEEKRKSLKMAAVPRADTKPETEASPQAANPDENTDAASLFYGHPLIKFLSQGSCSRNASYIKRETFSKVVVDLLCGQNLKPKENPDNHIDEALNNGIFSWNAVKIPDETLTQLKSLWVSAKGEEAAFKAELENWFDEMMDRVTGWYKKYTQIIVIAVGLIIAVVFNVDTLKIVDNLQSDEGLRNQVVNMSANFIKAHPNLEEEYQLDLKVNEKIAVIDSANSDSTLSKAQLDSASLQRFDSLRTVKDKYLKMADSLIQGDLAKMNGVMGVGLGSFKCWPCDTIKAKQNTCFCHCHQTCWFRKFWIFLCCLFKSMIGWIITALAISLGAPFWFDALNKCMKLRSSIAPAPEPKAKDNEKKTVKK